MGKEIQKVNPDRKRQRFTKEFKLEAVKLLEQGAKSATQLALELGTERCSKPRLARKSCEEFIALMTALNLPKPKFLDIAVPANRGLGLPQG